MKRTRIPPFQFLTKDVLTTENPAIGLQRRSLKSNNIENEPNQDSEWNDLLNLVKDNGRRASRRVRTSFVTDWINHIEDGFDGDSDSVGSSSIMSEPETVRRATINANTCEIFNGSPYMSPLTPMVKRAGRRKTFTTQGTSPRTSLTPRNSPLTSIKNRTSTPRNNIKSIQSPFIKTVSSVRKSPRINAIAKNPPAILAPSPRDQIDPKSSSIIDTDKASNPKHDETSNHEITAENPLEEEQINSTSIASLNNTTKNTSKNSSVEDSVPDVEFQADFVPDQSSIYENEEINEDDQINVDELIIPSRSSTGPAITLKRNSDSVPDEEQAQFRSFSEEIVDRVKMSEDLEEQPDDSESNKDSITTENHLEEQINSTTMPSLSDTTKNTSNLKNSSVEDSVPDVEFQADFVPDQSLIDENDEINEDDQINLDEPIIPPRSSTSPAITLKRNSDSVPDEKQSQLRSFSEETIDGVKISKDLEKHADDSESYTELNRDCITAENTLEEEQINSNTLSSLNNTTKNISKNSSVEDSVPDVEFQTDFVPDQSMINENEEINEDEQINVDELVTPTRAKRPAITRKRTSEALDSNVSPVLRRSKRRKIKPVEYWRGERVKYLYETVNGSPGGIIEIETYPVQEKAQKKTIKKRKQNPKNNMKLFDLSIHAVGVEDVEKENAKRVKAAQKKKLVFAPASLKWDEMMNNSAVKMAIIQKDKKKKEALGKLKFGPLAIKQKQLSGDYTTHFTVSYGKFLVCFEPDTDSFIVETGYYFKIPADTNYELRNLRKEDGILDFKIVQTNFYLHE